MPEKIPEQFAALIRHKAAFTGKPVVMGMAIRKAERPAQRAGLRIACAKHDTLHPGMNHEYKENKYPFP